MLGCCCSDDNSGCVVQRNGLCVKNAISPIYRSDWGSLNSWENRDYDFP